jgi:hypothetical protein
VTGVIPLAALLAALAVRPEAVAQAPAPGAALVINEVAYDPPAGAAEGGHEWVELVNTSRGAISLEGWQIADNRSSDDLPAVVLAPGELLVVAGGEGFRELYPAYDGKLAVLAGSIGNGLGNSGDQVRVLDAAGTVVDGMSYGDDSAVLDPSPPDVAEGHSLERIPAGADTDTAADWADQPTPSPGRPAGPAGPTAGPSAVPPPTAPPGATVVINEHLPAPRDVDWDGDGQPSANDEWVELFNLSEVELAVRGWQLDDQAEGGSDPYVFPDGAVIPPRGYLLIFKRESGLALNNGGDSVRLLRPDGVVADETSFTRSAPDASFARQGDGVGPWTDGLAPTPGRSNGAAPAGPTGVASTATAGPSPTPVPRPTADALFLPLLVSEVLFDPLLSGNDAAEEWVEVYNPTDSPASLSGWAIGDAAAWDVLPPLVLPPRGFAVIAAGAGVVARLAADGVTAVAVADGRLGNGLANGGDLVRLRGPTGAPADAVSYGLNLDAFDPAVPIGPPGSSIERLPPEQDSDSAEDWWPQLAPSPGRAGRRHTGPPRVRINELLPAPARRDWDGNGSADHTDEWVELFNAGDIPVDLARWELVRGEGEGWSFRLAPGTTMAPRGFRVITRAESGLALANGSDTLRLRRDDGVEADRVRWERGPGADRSLSRTVDGAGEWTDAYAVTPGGPNRPEAPADRRAAGDSADVAAGARWVALAEARGLATGLRVLVRGRITAAPGVFGEREAYLGDETAGLRVYLRPPGALPRLALGERAAAVGRLRDYHGERELVIERPADLWSEGSVEPVPPLDWPTGRLDEAVEGRLVRLGGRVLASRGNVITLDDGSGAARIVLRPATGLARPTVGRDHLLVVVGIAGQSAPRAPWEGGYRLQPRAAADLAAPAGRGGAPRRWPQTGRAGP